MAAKHLSARENWQKKASESGIRGEITLAAALRCTFPRQYEVIEKPPKLCIYPERPGKKRKGICPDIKIINHNTGKSLYLEKKTGDACAGNAHNRAGVYMGGGRKRAVRRVDPSVADEPFFIVFSGATFQLEEYQDRIKVDFECTPHAIMDPDFANINEVAKRIMEIV